MDHSGILSMHSFDARSTEFEKGSHWYDEKSLGSRANFQASATPASLIINEAQDSDSGIYRCRVDFHKSPTRNSRVQLKIIRKFFSIFFLQFLHISFMMCLLFCSSNLFCLALNKFS